MKKLNMILAIVLFSMVAEMSGQKVIEGAYLSSNDFKRGNLAYLENSGKEGYKFYLREISKSSSVKIVIGDSAIKLNKDSIFGYRDKNNTCFRFYHKVAYRIINPTEKIMIYSRTSSLGGIKNYQRVTDYFFSANANGPIYPLSKRNLKSVFSEDISLLELLDIYFHGDRELTDYDYLNKIYNLNSVYALSKR
jgi:hypothetical protein